MTYDNLPVLALVFGALALGILLAFAARGIRRAWRERAARVQFLADPTVCVECGEPWHYPCPHGQWRSM